MNLSSINKNIEVVEVKTKRVDVRDEDRDENRGDEETDFDQKIIHHFNCMVRKSPL